MSLLTEKLSNISIPKIKDIPQGKVRSIKEFYDSFLHNYAIDKEVALKWHKLLMTYINSDKPLFAIRGYNSVPTKDRYNDLRRGFLTETTNFSFFYTDNFFAAYFLKMCLDGYVPTFEDFYQTMKKRRFPSRFGQNTQNERELMAIPQGENPKINSAGFKLAHIIPVGKNYNIGNNILGTSEILDRYFPKGEREDWKLCTDNQEQFFKRTIEQTDQDMKKIAIAYFLRFVHPFNYFLCVKKGMERNDKCLEIAEYQPLLDYMHDKMLDTFGNEYIEFLNLIMVDKKYTKTMFNVNQNEIEIYYGVKFIKQPTWQTTGQYTGQITEQKQLSIVWDFLNNTKANFRQLERKFLEIDKGGIEAEKIVNSYGFTIKEQGILNNSEIDSETKKRIVDFLDKIISFMKDI